MITITAATGTDGGVLVPRRLLATRVHWGVCKGIIIYSMYLYVGDKMPARNVEILRKFAEHANGMRGSGLMWVLGAGCNMSTGEMGYLDWLYSIGGIAAAPRATTCRQSLPGTTIDWFMLAAKLAPRASRPHVNEEAETRFHLPVILLINAKGASLLLGRM
eukprot:7791190-Pyramimonas_sp.AAC.1